MNDQVKAATDETRKLSDDELRERIVRLGFRGDHGRFEMFIGALREALPADVTVVVRGSVVIGVRWEDGAPFDADGPGTSDLDLTLVGGEVVDWFHPDEFYIPGVHSKPLNEERLHAAPSLVPLRQTLTRLVGRPVNIQATKDWVMFVREHLMGQPYLTLIGKLEDA